MKITKIDKIKTKTTPNIMNTDMERTHIGSYLTELNIFKDCLRKGLTSKEIYELLPEKGIINRSSGKPYRENTIRKLISQEYGGYKNYILNTYNDI